MTLVSLSLSLKSRFQFSEPEAQALELKVRVEIHAERSIFVGGLHDETRATSKTRARVSS